MLTAWLLNFLGLPRLMQVVAEFKTGSPVPPIELLEALISPIFPACLLLEFGFLVGIKRCGWQTLQRYYRVPLSIFVVNSLLGVYVALNLLGPVAQAAARHAPFTMPWRWYWLPVGYALWELGHYAYHYGAHRIRLLWCVHAPHHTGETINHYLPISERK